MFADVVVAWVDTVLLFAVLIVQAVAIIHCALQRSEAFAAIGTLSKPLWLALLFGLLLFSLLFGLTSGYTTWALLAAIGAIVYLVDIRPSIRDIGSGSW